MGLNFYNVDQTGNSRFIEVKSWDVNGERISGRLKYLCIDASRVGADGPSEQIFI